MKETNINSLASLMDSVITNNHPMKITNPQYLSMYLKIFFDEIESNNGAPIHYDAFGDRLWAKINRSVDDFAKEAEEFMNTWNAWFYLYSNLKQNNRLNNSL